MSNYKIRVNSKSESKEAQQLFFELGYEKGACSTGGYPALIIATPESRFQKTPYSSRATSLDHESHSQYKEITLPELRDLVVLKRNNRNDRTHTDQDNWSWFISSNGTGYVFGAGNANGLHQWDESSLNMVDLKPIEKPMKEPKQAEFLVKTDSGYVLQVLDENAGGDGVVRIPDGAEIAIEYTDGRIYFWTGNDYCKLVDGELIKSKYPDCLTSKQFLDEWPNSKVLWKRETLNDQVASAEEYRKMISNAASIGLTSVVADLAQYDDGRSGNASLQGQSDFPLNNYELNHRVAKAFNAVRGTDLNEDDVNYIRELINLTISHYGERK